MWARHQTKRRISWCVLPPTPTSKASAVDCGQSFSDSEVLTPSGDISAMGVRAELDERDCGVIKIGQTVLVRSAAFRDREFAGKVLSISPIVQSSRISSRDQRNLTDVSVAEVVVDLAEPGPLAVGMKVDVYFRYDKPRQ